MSANELDPTPAKKGAASAVVGTGTSQLTKQL